MKALIIGKGSAGKRHGHTLGFFGYTPYYVDVNGSGDFTSIAEAAEHVDCDLFVIASPPNMHLEHILECIMYSRDGVKIVCEKPLYESRDGLGMLNAVYDMVGRRKVYVTYNYRFHDGITAINNAGDGLYKFMSSQYRPNLPQWGVFTDHIPHTIDIAMGIVGKLPLDHVKLDIVRRSGFSSVHIVIGDDRNTVIIDDIVNTKDSDSRKMSYVSTPGGVFYLEHDSLMYMKMWNDIINDGGVCATLDDGHAVQIVMEAIRGVIVS